ncbi:hypothetical protein PR048_026363 [Dryococelus australis]|uniref:Uncharacterized protein n=1 Tax=Dryococelus australis TaxID=614101 RepID=A0ABQ9GL44_9NEOP|nr:hypothetical protein PR048_026363 [Dryococelus australis]
MLHNIIVKGLQKIPLSPVHCEVWHYSEEQRLPSGGLAFFRQLSPRAVIMIQPSVGFQNLPTLAYPALQRGHYRRSGKERSQHPAGVVSGSHGEPKSGWPGRDLNPSQKFTTEPLRSIRSSSNILNQTRLVILASVLDACDLRMRRLIILLGGLKTRVVGLYGVHVSCHRGTLEKCQGGENINCAEMLALCRGSYQRRCNKTSYIAVLFTYFPGAIKSKWLSGLALLPRTLKEQVSTHSRKITLPSSCGGMLFRAASHCCRSSCERQYKDMAETTARLARRSHEALDVRVSVARIAPSHLDLDAQLHDALKINIAMSLATLSVRHPVKTEEWFRMAIRSKTCSMGSCRLACAEGGKPAAPSPPIYTLSASSGTCASRPYCTEIASTSLVLSEHMIRTILQVTNQVRHLFACTATVLNSAPSRGSQARDRRLQKFSCIHSKNRLLPTNAIRVRFSARSPQFSHVGIVPGRCPMRWVFSGISNFPCPYIPGASPYAPHSPSSVVKMAVTTHEYTRTSSVPKHVIKLGEADSRGKRCPRTCIVWDIRTNFLIHDGKCRIQMSSYSAPRASNAGSERKGGMTMAYLELLKPINVPPVKMLFAPLTGRSRPLAFYESNPGSIPSVATADFGVLTSVQSMSRQSQCSRVLQAPSRTVGFIRRFHTLSSIHATNTSLAVVPQSPHLTSLAHTRPDSLHRHPESSPNARDASRRAKAPASLARTFLRRRQTRRNLQQGRGAVTHASCRAARQPAVHYSRVSQKKGGREATPVKEEW